MTKRGPGKPRKFESPEQMQEAINRYFLKCDMEEKPYTVCGLALELDCDRSTIINYHTKEQYKEYFGIVKKAKLKIENQLEERLATSNVAGTIFNLKANFRWEDPTVLTGSGGGPIETKSTVEAGPGVQGVLDALKGASSRRPEDCDA